jgi:hypothetical protein
VSVDKVLGQVGLSNGAPSMPELLFREFRHKRISKDEYDTATSVWVADNVMFYQFIHYPSLSPVVLEYARARINGVKRDRDESMHRRVGAWTHTVRQLIDQNDADRSLLMWCLRICQSKKLMRQVGALDKRLSEYALESPQYLDTAMNCQIMDSIEKQKSERTR